MKFVIKRMCPEAYLDDQGAWEDKPGANTAQFEHEFAAGVVKGMSMCGQHGYVAKAYLTYLKVEGTDFYISGVTNNHVSLCYGKSMAKKYGLWPSTSGDINTIFIIHPDLKIELI